MSIFSWGGASAERNCPQKFNDIFQKEKRETKHSKNAPKHPRKNLSLVQLSKSFHRLGDPNRSDFKITNASDCNRHTQKITATPKQPLKPTLWTRSAALLGFKRWGFKQNLRISEEKGLFPPISSGFPRCSFVPCGKGRKRQKKGEKGRFRPISGKGGQTPLKPPFVTPPFAAAQLWTRELPVVRGSYRASEAPHSFGTPPEHVATTRV